MSGVGGSSSNSAIVSGLGTAVAGILVLTGTVLFAALAVSIPTLLSLMLVLLVVLVILIVRQAAIVLLISIAPLASQLGSCQTPKVYSKNGYQCLGGY